MKRLSILLVSVLLSTQIFAQFSSSELEQRLFDLADVQFKKIDTPEGYSAAYELRIKQALDHKDPSKGYFYQRAFLSHRDFDRPTVICTEGYNRSRNRVYELTNLVNGNQIDVEHRYYGKSTPENHEDYKYLNLEQATADLHHINELFRQVYTGKWLSTGISKGGQTTIFYRYFYPEDVDVSVPYVAPLNLELNEQRIYSFLDTVGSQECRTAINDVQVRLLKNKKEVLPLVKWHSKGQGLEFNYLTFEQAFEYAVLEYPFSFWQWGASCEDIPSKKAPLEDVISHFLDVSGLAFFSDVSMTAYASHYYQAGSEMGYYAYETDDHLKGLITALKDDEPSAIFMPNKMPITFDGKLVNKAAEWMTKNGNQFIHINGNADTWSATAVRPTKGLDAHWFFIAGADHGQARIKNMSAADKAKLIEALEGWLDIEIED